MKATTNGMGAIRRRRQVIGGCVGTAGLALLALLIFILPILMVRGGQADPYPAPDGPDPRLMFVLFWGASITLVILAFVLAMQTIDAWKARGKDEGAQTKDEG